MRASLVDMAADAPAGITRASHQPPAANPDWAGLWFKLVEEISGEFVGGRYGRRQPGTGEIAWTFLPHDEHDGIGGLARLSRRDCPTADVRLPVLKESYKPSVAKRVWALLRFLAKTAKPAAAWKSHDASWAPPRGAPTPGTAIATECFEVDRTQRLADMARSHGVSLNSYLLSALGRASHSELAQGPAVWMMPVNMRGAVDIADDTANHTAYLQIELGHDETPAQVHGRVKQALARREHWATWLFVNAGRLVGYAGMRRMYHLQLKRFQGRVCVGAFSNLGTWDGFGEWAVCPPVTRTCPLGVGVITSNGKLSVTIDAHPSIAASPAWPRALMDRWLSELGV